VYILDLFQEIEEGTESAQLVLRAQDLHHIIPRTLITVNLLRILSNLKERQMRINNFIKNI
jgi:hypothetical protein